jgi:DNA-binding MarR family transcriptional regulator
VENDSVDRIVQAWHRREPELDSSSLEITGRLLLCDVLNTLRRVGDQHGSKPTDLARSSLITTGAMTSRLDRLERSGLIRRTPDPADRRGVLIRLTSKGSRVARQALHELIAANQVFLKPLSGQQRESIASALKLLLLQHEPR